MSGQVLTILVAVLAFSSVAGIGLVFAGGDGGAQKKRMKQVSGVDTGRVVRGKRNVAAIDQSQARRKQVQETLKDLEDKQKKQKKRSLSIKNRLRQAGLGISPLAFWMISFGFGAIVFLFTWLKIQNLPIAAAIGFAMALGVPRWVIAFLSKRRKKKFSKEFVGAIDIIVRGVKTGLPLNECLKIIAREVPDPVGEEFRRLVENNAVGVALDEGLARMHERMPLPELNFFTIVLMIQQKTGGNLAETLNNLASVLRARKMMREKISAMSSEAKASAMIIGSLPPLVMLIVNFTSPDYMRLMFTENLGRVMLAGGVLWMCIGIFMMRKMINFKI